MQTSTEYEQVINDLRHAYDQRADERDGREKQSWKVEERARFLALLQQEGKQRLLEIGAGPGRDSLFFQDSGLDVVSTDLSPEHVRLCRAKGLMAHVMDFLNLEFLNGSFDALYALNCLLHVPKRDLPQVLREIQRVLRPMGLLYMGVYGGLDREGTWPEDVFEPKRFFSYYTDEQMQEVVGRFFEVVTFKAIPLDEGPQHFQSMILRRT